MRTVSSFKEDLNAYREGIWAQGFWALQIYRFGHARFKLKNKLLSGLIRIIHAVLNKLSEILFGISINPTAVIGKALVIEHFGSIIIHGSTVIGDYCIIRQGVTLGNRQLDKPLDAPILGDRVNVGAGAKILGKVWIGDGANIGANAVVLSDVPAGATAVGIPARIIHPRQTPSAN